MKPRLYRCRDEAMISGVCAGLGRYLGIGPSWVRLFFLLLALAGNGIGVFVYLLLWMVVPDERAAGDASLPDAVRLGSQEIAGRARAMGDDLRDIVRHPPSNAGVVIGAALVIVGSVYFIQNLHLPWLQWVDFHLLWPLLLIMAGFVLLFKRAKGE